MPLTQENAALARFFIEGANKIFANAEALYGEATILANSGAWARALLLHQIALEECAKVDMLGAAVTSLLMNHAVEVKALQRAFARHESKNKTNAYFLPKTEAERLANEEGDFSAASREFKQLQDAFHKESNTYKNAALYVDFGAQFTSPLEVIDEEAFLKVRSRNDDFMAAAHGHVRLLNRWAADLQAAASEAAELLEVLDIESIERGNDDQMNAFLASFDSRMRELLERRLRRGDGDSAQTC
jgi:AbiV family abortive infection protein